jgi:heat shock protein HslJ
LCAVLGCAGPEPAVEDEPETTVEQAAELPPLELRMLVGNWKLVDFAGAALAEGLESPTLEINEGGETAGFAGVNRFMTSVDPGEFFQGRLVFAPAASTMMAGPPEAMELETRYLDRLASVTGYFIEGDELRLFAGEELVLTFQRSPGD